jgi:hypothetical protein
MAIEAREPLLKQIRKQRIHEGSSAVLRRADHTSQDIRFRQATAELAIPREQMRRITLDQLRQHIAHMAEQFARHQSEMLFSGIEESVQMTGNSVSARELGMKEAFLESMRRIYTEFDPDTLQPIGQSIVLHPSQFESFKSQAEEWEKDPEFIAEVERIRLAKLEEWRAREDNRKLVD